MTLIQTYSWQLENGIFWIRFSKNMLVVYGLFSLTNTHTQYKRTGGNTIPPSGNIKKEKKKVLALVSQWQQTCIPWNLLFRYILFHEKKTSNDAVTLQCQSQFTPKIKANAVRQFCKGEKNCFCTCLKIQLPKITLGQWPMNFRHHL